MSDLDTSLKGPRRAEVRLLHPSAAKRSPGGGGVTRHLDASHGGGAVTRHSSFSLADDIASAELLSAAAKFELVALKTMCEDVLPNIISMENCTKVMLVADDINNSRLREACLHSGIKNINRIPGKSSMLYSSSTLMLLHSFTR